MKRIVILCDGTLEDADTQQDTSLYTNIGRLSRAVREEDCRLGTAHEVEQIKYYLGGVGTEDGTVGGLVSGAFGTGIMDSVRNIYSFIGLNWEPGDEIFLFGFSRGAYTVRLVASLISIIGILHPRRTLHLFPALLQALDERAGESPNANYKSAQTIQKLLASYRSDKAKQDLDYAKSGKFLIKCVGLFDTVATRGRPSTLRRSPSQEPPAIKFDSFGFDETRLESCIEHAYQALALDEHRIDYVPVLWSSNPLGRPRGQTLEQVWFSGAHADVGGGYSEGDLGYLTLWWMCSKVEAMLEIDMEWLREKMCKETVETYGRMPPHQSRVGQFLLAKSIDRPVPVSLNPMTNELIHSSVEFQPVAQVRPPVSGALSNRDIIARLEPLEEKLRDYWPTSGEVIKGRGMDEDKSLSDTELAEKSTPSPLPTKSTARTGKRSESLVSPPPSLSSTSLSDQETSDARLDDASSPYDQYLSDDLTAQSWRETSLRLEPTVNEPRHVVPRAAAHPFRAIGRALERWGGALESRDERKEREREARLIDRQTKREEKKFRDREG